MQLRNLQLKDVERAYMVLCVRDDERAIGIVRLSWDSNKPPAECHIHWGLSTLCVLFNCLNSIIDMLGFFSVM